MAYLPAIDDSPTKMEVVLELLLQSKEKATNLGLEDTDIVMDLAIYAKAVEVLLNPSYKDLKQFFVLRLGGFHTCMSFLSVIGKRFADAGMRDLILESGLLGITMSLCMKCYKTSLHVISSIYFSSSKNAIAFC